MVLTSIPLMRFVKETTGQAHDFIMELDEGYQTKVGKGGLAKRWAGNASLWREYFFVNQNY